jgi:hypothetical protein
VFVSDTSKETRFDESERDSKEVKSAQKPSFKIYFTDEQSEYGTIQVRPKDLLRLYRD